MEIQSGDPQSEYIRVSRSFSESEAKFVAERKVKIAQCLSANGINCEAASVPHIAVLGSGGGERAMVGLLGCLDQMGQDNLLDSTLYLCGVSGSTWCMSALYEDPDWSSKLRSAMTKVIERITETPFDLTAVTKWLAEAIKDENYSLTDFWAATVVYENVKMIDQSRLSDTKVDPINPYPIYTVNDQDLKKKGHNKACWFELSPHEVGYSHLGAFIDTSVLRSCFEAGELKKKVEERDMLYLQALCGSALADGEEDNKTIQEMIMKWINRIFGISTVKSCSAKEKIIVQDISGFSAVKSRSVEDEINVQEEEARLMIAELLKQYDCIEDWDWNEDPMGVNRRCSEKNGSLTAWFQSCKDEFVKIESYFSMLSDVTQIVLKTMEVMANWSWGKKYNFLYKYPAEEGKFPEELLSETHRHLEDAGILLNSPYVAALRPERKVDLILSFDFSAGDPFMTVNLAAEYCKESGIPFPSVDVPEEEKENPKDFYVFKGEQGPTVIHMPLFNIVNCEGDVEKWRKRYPTFSLPYDKETAEELMRVAALNVANNKKRILEEIKAVSK